MRSNVSEQGRRAKVVLPSNWCIYQAGCKTFRVRTHMLESRVFQELVNKADGLGIEIQDLVLRENEACIIIITYKHLYIGGRVWYGGSRPRPPTGKSFRFVRAVRCEAV